MLKILDNPLKILTVVSIVNNTFKEWNGMILYFLK